MRYIKCLIWSEYNLFCYMQFWWLRVKTDSLPTDLGITAQPAKLVIFCSTKRANRISWQIRNRYFRSTLEYDRHEKHLWLLAQEIKYPPIRFFLIWTGLAWWAVNWFIVLAILWSGRPSVRRPGEPGSNERGKSILSKWSLDGLL